MVDYTLRFRNTVIWRMHDDSIPRLMQDPSCPYWAAALVRGDPTLEVFRMGR